LRFFLPHSFLPNRFLQFALLAALTASMAFLPSRACAQATTPAASPTSTAATDAGHSQAAPDSKPVDPEEEQINAFLQAPAVRALARLLHLNLKTADNLFLTIDFAIIVLAIGIPLGRVMPKIIRKRSMTLQHNLTTARKLQEDARTRLQAVEAQLAKLDGEIQKYREEMEEELKKDEVHMKASIEEEKARIVAAAEQEISVAAIHARRGLRKFAAELAVDRAAGKLALTPETDRALIAEFSASMSQNHTAGAGGRSNAGGKN